MISKILILVSTLFILTGVVGIIMKPVGKKLVFLSFSSIGTVALSFVQMTAFGIMGGFFQVIFRLVSLLFLILLLCSICKKNSIAGISDMDGIGRKMPYLFLLLVVFSTMVIGIPMTGTFSGILYSEIGLLGDDFGMFTYIGMAGNVFGIIIIALLLFPILKRAYFPEKDALQKKEIITPGKGLVICSVAVGVILLVLCIYQKPVLTLAQRLMEMIMD